MTRTHGWNSLGHRPVAKIPCGHWQTITFIAGSQRDRIAIVHRGTDQRGLGSGRRVLGSHTRARWCRHRRQSVDSRCPARTAAGRGCRSGDAVFVAVQPGSEPHRDDLPETGHCAARTTSAPSRAYRGGSGPFSTCSPRASPCAACVMPDTVLHECKLL